MALIDAVAYSDFVFDFVFDFMFEFVFDITN